MKLSKVERWILSNQFAILAKLDKDDADSYEKMRQIVERGFELHYDWISEHIYDGINAMSPEESEEVLDILDMFRSLKYAYDEISDKTGIDVHWVKFPGFSGNTETKQLGYTHFLIKREEKFTDLDRGDDFNSHAPLLDHYRIMLREWNKSIDKYKLSKTDVMRITSVSIHSAPNKANSN